jgi:HlyD family secretion protein
VEVTDADCKKVTDAMKKKPAVAKKLDDIREKMRSPDADRRALMGQMAPIYAELGVDSRIAGACRRREGGNGGGGTGGMSGGRGGAGGGAAMAGGSGGARTGGARAGGAQAPGAAGGRADQAGRTVEGPKGPGMRSRTRTGLVFVQKADSTWEPRMVRLGVANYDYTEVLDGLKEGERVALLSAAAMQAQRQAATDRARQMMSGNSPLGGGAAGPGGGGRPGGGGGGGAPAAGAARPRG